MGEGIDTPMVFSFLWDPFIEEEGEKTWLVQATVLDFLLLKEDLVLSDAIGSQGAKLE